MFDVCVIGHVVRDVNTIGGRERAPTPGGTAYYAGVVYASLGLRAAVVTRVAREDESALLGELRAAGVEVINLGAERTTVFRNAYAPDNPDLRIQHVDARAGTIGIDDLPRLSARAVHLGPLTPADLDPAIIGGRPLAAETVALDAQVVVCIIVEGCVVPSRRPASGPDLRRIDVLQADDQEIVAFAGGATVAESAARVCADGAGMVLVTKASRGSTIFNGAGTLRIEAVPPRRAVDATGCGDTFLAAFLSRRIRGEGVAECASFAAVAASLNIENLGPFRGGADDVLARWAEVAGPARAVLHRAIGE